jgi:hypothetical protein
MTRSILSRLVLGLAVLTAPAIMLGCSEEPKPTDTPKTDTAAPAPAPTTPSAPVEAGKTDTPAPTTPPTAK